MSRRLAHAARDERGMTLIEVLVVAVLSVLVLGATMYIVENALRASNRVQDRTDAVQRGRTVMEQIVQRLRSQVCLGTGVPAIVDADDNQVTFYVDLGDENFTPQKRKIAFDPTAGTVTESIWNGTGTPPTMTWPTSPSKTRVMTTGLARNGTTPFFRYYAFTQSDPITPSAQLTTPLVAADAAKTVAVGVSFVAKPTRAQNDVVSTLFENQIYVRTADPQDPIHSPACI